MLHPLLPFAIKGVIWYQGESNANNVAQAAAYRGQFSSLITSWRREWGQTVILRSGGTEITRKGRHPEERSDEGSLSIQGCSPPSTFPFLWVQLPNFGAADASPPTQSAWATQRESMEAALSLPNTGRRHDRRRRPGDLHPRNKLDVGIRLARVALKTVYGGQSSRQVRRTARIICWATPMSSISRTLMVASSSARPTAGPGAFAIAGVDRKFVWANAKIVAAGCMSGATT